MARPQFVQRWAHRRSSAEAMRAEHGYRRRVGLLRLLIPATAAGIVISLVAWPMMINSGDGFDGLLSKEDLINGRDEMKNPRFVGTDSANQPYTVTADVAMRPANGGDRIFLMMPIADITLKGGDYVNIRAEQGWYDRDAETLKLDGAVDLFTDTGLRVQTESILFDLRDGSAQGDDPVQSQGPWGNLASQGIRYQSAGQIFEFPGRPTLVLYPHKSETEG
jgi:lipopolysaccharide export system protein LptC